MPTDDREWLSPEALAIIDAVADDDLAQLRARTEKAEAELRRCAELAGDALGTDPALRTAEGCVSALAGYVGSLHDDLTQLRGRIDDLTTDLRLNAKMLARQCDMARDAESAQMEAEAELRAAMASGACPAFYVVAAAKPSCPTCNDTGRVACPHDGPSDTEAHDCLDERPIPFLCPDGHILDLHGPCTIPCPTCGKEHGT